MKECDVFVWCLLDLQAELGFSSFDPIYLGTTFKEAACLPFLLAAVKGQILCSCISYQCAIIWKMVGETAQLLSSCLWLWKDYWIWRFLRDSIPVWITEKENLLLVLSFLSNSGEEICTNQIHLWLYEDLWLFQKVFFI